MFKLPVCPYCRTVYRYNRVRKIELKEKTKVCYHCKKEFKIERFKGFFVLGAVVFVLAVATNLFLLNSLETLNLTPLLVFTVIYVILGLVCIPFFINFKKSENKSRKK